MSWVAVKFFPLTPTFLRLFSAICFAGAIALIWNIARRHSTVFIASIATGAAFLLSESFLTLAKDARFYGISLLRIAWAAKTYDRLYSGDRPSLVLLISNTFAHSLAVCTSYVAGMFSFAILVSFAVCDQFRNERRPLVYLSVVAAWIPLLFCIPFIFTHSDATSWMSKPGLSMIYHPFSGGIDVGSGYFIIIGFALLFVLRLFVPQLHQEPIQEPKQANHLYFLAFVILMVPYGIFVLSRLGMPMLIDRYAMPPLIAYAFLITFILNTVEITEDSSIKPRWFATTRSVI
ncbi:MAG: hypothetical protein P8L44_15515 [Opitutales bacterium]|nr:hypothetical protein [Opitutales bacterium]